MTRIWIDRNGIERDQREKTVSPVVYVKDGPEKAERVFGVLVHGDCRVVYRPPNVFLETDAEVELERQWPISHELP